MALLFMDSVDHYVTADLLEKWTAKGSSPTVSAGNGRRGSSSLRITDNYQYAVKVVNASGTTAILGLAFKPSTLSPSQVFGIYDGVNSREHISLKLNADGSLSAYIGHSSSQPPANNMGTVIGTTAAGLVAAGVFTYIELKVVIHDTTGTVDVRVNGASVLSLTNQDTANNSTVWSAIWVGTSAFSMTIDYDDIYVCDGTGSSPWNGFLGDCRVDARVPTGAGATTGWTPSAGANYACVDDAAPDDDTDYVTAATSGLTDTYVVQDAPVAGAALYGIQHCLNLKKMDAGTCTVAPIIRLSGGSDVAGADLTPSTTYAYGLQIAATQPGGAAWTEAAFNAAEFGYRKTS